MAAVLERSDSSLEKEDPRLGLRHGLPVRVLVSMFVLFHILATLLWLLPGSALRKQILPIPAKYISYVGLWQTWNMFGPEPSSLNFNLSAVVTYRDGSQREWNWPRMEQLNLLSRYREERYRKFLEYGSQDSYSYIWSSMARFAALQLNDRDPANPAVRVQLWRHWWIVPPPPANGDISHDPPHQLNDYLFFDTALEPTAVQR